MHAQGLYLVPSYVVETVGMDGNSLWHLTDSSLWQAAMLCCHALMMYMRYLIPPVWFTCSDELVAAAEVCSLWTHAFSTSQLQMQFLTLQLQMHMEHSPEQSDR